MLGFECIGCANSCLRRILKVLGLVEEKIVPADNVWQDFVVHIDGQSTQALADGQFVCGCSQSSFVELVELKSVLSK